MTADPETDTLVIHPDCDHDCPKGICGVQADAGKAECEQCLKCHSLLALEAFEDFDDEEENFDNHAIAVPISVCLGPNADSVVVARDGIASIDIHPIPSPPSKESASSSMSLLLSHLVSLHKKQTVECPSQPLAVRCLADGSVLALARDPDYLLHFQSTDAAEFKNVSSTSAFKSF